MSDSQASSVTIGGDSDGHLSPKTKPKLTGLPPIFVLKSFLPTGELHRIENELSSRGAPLTYDIHEAKIVLANITRERRARIELQWANVRIHEGVIKGEPESVTDSTIKDQRTRPAKRRKLSHVPDSQGVKVESGSSRASSPLSDAEDDGEPGAKPMSQLSISQADIKSNSDNSDSERDHNNSSSKASVPSFSGRIKVVRLEWLNQSLVKGSPQPFEPYVVYEAKVLPPLDPFVGTQNVLKHSVVGPTTLTANKPDNIDGDASGGILERAKAEAKPHFPRTQRRDRVNNAMKQEFAGRSFLHSGGSQSQSFTRPTKLLHQTTSEHDEGISHSLPPMPDWVLQKKIYSCERATPLRSPNDPFLEQLKTIKSARVLTGDEVGVRAYSTSIASIAAYPHALSSMQEILALPGCDQKIAQLFHEWQTDGVVQAAVDVETDEVLAVLRQFYEIWGVGDKTAREFYFEQDWRELDDITDRGWNTLTRVQQIGLKYYDEFLLKMPRSEVEAIAAIVTEHGRRVTDSGLECIIVGGYRRGKDESGDVDLILSHRDEHQTYNLVERVVESLEQEGWITHMLIMNLTNTKRDQQPVSLVPLNRAGHGFDTLDKALVVWQSQDWPSREADLAENPKAKNPNVHRRVDIIISPWRTVGCAVAGWTSGTTFQRDLRRYAKKMKGWKFDSSGVRERGTGRWIDLEKWGDPKTRAPSWQIAERRVFEGMGLVYREPWDRCTG